MRQIVKKADFDILSCILHNDSTNKAWWSLLIYQMCTQTWIL